MAEADGKAVAIGATRQALATSSAAMKAVRWGAPSLRPAPVRARQITGGWTTASDWPHVPPR
jgi:hypothetical protein